MPSDRKQHLALRLAARIETAGFARLVPPYAGSLDELPAAFWATFAESLSIATNEDPLEGYERLLMESAREVAYHCGQGIVTAWPWAPFVTPLDSPDATSDDVLHTLFATLASLGVDRCRIVELVPFERLVLRVPMPRPRRVESGSAGGSREPARLQELAVRGFCAGLMELAYGGCYDEAGPEGAFECRRTGAADLGDGSEFIVSRRER